MAGDFLMLIVALAIGTIGASSVIGSGIALILNYRSIKSGE